MSLSVRRDHQRVFWRAVRAGATIAEASACLGVSETTGWRWFHKAGGMSPLSLVEPGRSRSLGVLEREQILAGITAGHSVRAIARDIGRSPSTVSRELARNMRHHYSRRPGSPGGPRTRAWDYSPHRAQTRADLKLARPKQSRLALNQRLRSEVEARLTLRHSPEQIMRRLREDFPSEPEMWVSHETIYQSLYVQGRGALRRELATSLRTGRAVRRARRRSERRRERVLNMVNISERPAEVADRAVPGHWEGDLIIGKDSGSAIGTLVERTTRFVMLLHLPADHGAETVAAAMIAKMSDLPDHLRRTLTWDQGIEMANHTTIATSTELEIYFCDPHSPWQRGTNENTNGLLRQYFPKGTDLSFWGPGYLDFVAAELNNRPRKTLGWRTPTETLNKLLSNPTDPPSVATTT